MEQLSHERPVSAALLPTDHQGCIISYPSVSSQYLTDHTSFPPVSALFLSDHQGCVSFYPSVSALFLTDHQGRVISYPSVSALFLTDHQGCVSSYPQSQLYSSLTNLLSSSLISIRNFFTDQPPICQSQLYSSLTTRGV